MIEVVKIAHPLREITLEYDRSKSEFDCEQDLIGMHLMKHDYLQEIKQEQDRLIYEIGELEDELDAEVIRFNSLEADMLKKHKEIMAYAKDKKHTELVAEAKIGFFDLQQRMLDEHNTFISPLHAKSKVLGIATNDLTAKYLNDKGNYGIDAKEYDAKFLEVSDLSETRSLSIVQYDEEEGLLHELAKEMWQGQEILKSYALKYQPYNNRIKATYALSEEIKSILTSFQDTTDLLNCSISESYAKETGDIKKRPFYFMPPGNPKIKAAKLTYGAGMDTDGITQITFNVAIEDVRNLNAGGIVEQLTILQHFPKLLEKLVFTCSINFVMEDGTIFKMEQLRGDPIAMQWYSKLRSLPCSLFFFESRDARAYIWMGDMQLNEANIPVKGDSIGLSGARLQEACQRLYDACYYFMIFCHNTGFDPVPYIDSILAESGLPIPLEEVIADFNEDLASGTIQISTIQES